MHKNNLILIGFKNAGKTTVGKMLATTLNYTFIDTDRLVESFYRERKNKIMSTNDIFKSEGEIYFRQLEHEVVASLKSSENSVIATGGGCILNPDNVAMLKALGKVIYLMVSEHELSERQKRNRVPHFLNAENLKNSFQQTYVQRKPLYENAADIRIPADGKHAHEVVKIICNYLAR